MTANPTVAFVGVAVLEKLFGVEAIPDGPGRSIAGLYREMVGGIAASAALAAARLGAQARMIGRVGEDDAGAALRRMLEGAGVDCRGLEAAPAGKTPVSAVLVDPAGERMLVDHRDAALFAGAELPSGALQGVDAVMCDLRWPGGAGAALDVAARKGVPGVLDFDRAPERGTHRLIDRASHVIFGRDALAGLAGGATPEARLERVLARSPGRNLAVADGAEGVIWRDAAGRCGRIAPHDVEIVDAPGAALAFQGAAALALAEGRSFAAALTFANAVAALKASRPGGPDNLPTLAEVDALMETA